MAQGLFEGMHEMMSRILTKPKGSEMKLKSLLLVYAVAGLISLAGTVGIIWLTCVIVKIVFGL